ncbi:MAG: metal-dependent transcriptional regulator [Candidatus Krumholzibacteria bacterium]|nr:metal-dependent transcriptional regulator [Candidatus Krumholzibacteria bacterium]MDH4335992.1 metal-dependent transcriptional regulator [Candidatus Krumholzibacteria bacterium]MDH5268432.1 metal-dependent transcriptional regulator [Candidatus Krumholzibacteria bacterium]MDH5626939.1 metal-dependent transcriptional regulator [Candidatus Krumholzibacteria bacterium]
MEIWKRYQEKELSHSMAHYLQAVAALKKEKGFARVGDIADHLGVSKSGVTSMLRSLAARGLVDHERYGCVELTDTGKELAARTQCNRELLTVFFRDVLGVPAEVANEDACMIEHLVSQEAMTRLLRLTAILSSGEEDTAPVLDRYRRTRRVCPHHDVEACDICEEHCLVEMIARDLPRPRVAAERTR